MLCKNIRAKRIYALGSKNFGATLST